MLDFGPGTLRDQAVALAVPLTGFFRQPPFFLRPASTGRFVAVIVVVVMQDLVHANRRGTFGPCTHGWVYFKWVGDCPASTNPQSK